MKTASIFISLFLYAISLASPAFHFIKSEDSGFTSPEIYDGFTVLLMAWLGAFLGQFGWFANPLYYVSLLLVWQRRERVALPLAHGHVLAFSALALIVGITNTIWLFHQTLPGDEAFVTKMKLDHLGRGYYFWIAALVIPFAWSAYRSLYSKPR